MWNFNRAITVISLITKLHYTQHSKLCPLFDLSLCLEWKVALLDIKWIAVSLIADFPIDEQNCSLEFIETEMLQVRENVAQSAHKMRIANLCVVWVCEALIKPITVQ